MELQFYALTMCSRLTLDFIVFTVLFVVLWLALVGHPKHDTSIQRCFNVDPPSATLAQH